MSSIISGYEYDIFISYRQKDNKTGWVTEFVENLKNEIEATFKEDISIYFDSSPHGGLHEHHNVDDSLNKKLRSLILIPIVSRTYCDPQSFAWQNEFKAFINQAKNDDYGLKVNVSGGNVSSRILPVRIHDLSSADEKLFEEETNSVLRPIDFIYKETGVNRPLKISDDRKDNQANLDYGNQVNKIANAISETLEGMKSNIAFKDESASEDKKDISGDRNLGKELRRRNVFRASLVYLLAALIFWKVMDISKPLLNLTDSIVQIFTLALVLLFPIAVLMAWLYERSPEGFIRTSSAAARANPFRDSQKKPLTSNTFIILLVVTLGALFILFKPLGQTTELQASVDVENSIAVMAFEDMSPEGDQEFFSDGISEELINALAKLPNIKVTGRTSSFAYKGQTQNLQKIGQELGVSTILEGSIRKSGNQLRITAQLVKVEDGFHIWSGTFDKELTDVFKIQDEITSAIMQQLKLHLDESGVSIAATETSLNAYEVYLKARQKLAVRGLSLYEARDLFEQVIQLDPKYSPGYSGLGRTLALIPSWYYAPDAKEMNARAKDYARIALELNPENAEAYSVLGCASAFNEWDFEGAEQYFQKSYELNPNDTEILNFLGDYYSYTWHPKAVEIESKALELDPLHPVKYNDLSFAYAFVKDWQKSEEVGAKAYTMDSALVSSFTNLVRAQIELGYLDKAYELVGQYPVTDRSVELSMKEQKVWIEIARNNFDIAISLLEELENAALANEYNPSKIAECFLRLESYDKAADWLEKAYQEKDYYLMASLIFTLPEELPNHEGIQKALDKPELNNLFDLRRRNREMRISTK